MEIPRGTNLQIAGLGVPNLFRSDSTAGVSYPYIIDDVVSIKKSSAVDFEYDYYYYFYDWEIIVPSCTSDFAVLAIIPEICNSTLDNEVFDNIFIAPNPNNGQFEIIGLKDMYQYNVEVTAVSGKILFSCDNFTGGMISLTNYSDGLYFLKISNDKGQKVIKFVIQK